MVKQPILHSTGRKFDSGDVEFGILPVFLMLDFHFCGNGAVIVSIIGYCYNVAQKTGPIFVPQNSPIVHLDTMSTHCLYCRLYYQPLFGK